MLPNTACPDWAARLQRRMPPITTSRLPVRTPAAKKLDAFYRQLCMPDLLGKPLVGDIPETTEWLGTIGRALFGGPTIREAMVLVSKKNSKTSSGSLLYLAAFMANSTPNLPFTIVAPTISIANFSFDQIEGAVDADPELQVLVRVRSHAREIVHHQTGATLVVKPLSLKALTGLKGSVLFDELHVAGGMREGMKLRQQLRGALAANPAARGLYITTQSDDMPAGVFAAMLKYARQVRDGKLHDPAFLPVLYEPWPGCDPWSDPSTWPLLLPSYPHIANENFYRAAIQEAEASGPTAIAEAKSQYFNVEIGAGEGGQGWIVAQKFGAAKAKFSLDELLEWAEQVAVGIDLGGSGDLSAMAVLGIGPGGVWRCWVRGWLTADGLGQVNVRNESRFRDFTEAGDLRIIEPGGDVSEITGLCEQVRDTGKLVGVGVDPAGAADLADALEASGFVMDRDLFGIGQSAYRLAPAVRTVERKIDSGRITFAAQDMMGWCLGNVIVKQKGNAPSIDKQFALDRIDPVMALLDAVTVQIVHREVPVDAEAMVG